MSIFFTEANYENAIIELFQEMGYHHIYAPNIERDFNSPLYEDEASIVSYQSFYA